RQKLDDRERAQLRLGQHRRRHSLAGLHELPFRQLPEVAAEERGADLLGLARGRIAMHERRDLSRQDPLRLARLRMPAYLSLQVVDRLAPEEREILEEADDVGVASVEPELVHLVGRGLRDVAPYDTDLGYPDVSHNHIL